MKDFAIEKAELSKADLTKQLHYGEEIHNDQMDKIATEHGIDKKSWN